MTGGSHLAQCARVQALLVGAALLLTLSPAATAATAADIGILEPQQFRDMATSGQVDLILDVRRQFEWDNGHIENATHIPDFHVLLRDTPEAEMDGLLKGVGIFACKNCRTIVYCGSGARARMTLNFLQDMAGWTGQLYNGLGIRQWLSAGYTTVDTPSTKAPCMTAQGNQLHEDGLFCAKNEEVLASSRVPVLLPAAVRSSLRGATGNGNKSSVALVESRHTVHNSFSPKGNTKSVVFWVNATLVGLLFLAIRLQKKHPKQPHHLTHKQ